jgi:transcriptional regulator with XRE-family HTH domain
MPLPCIVRRAQTQPAPAVPNIEAIVSMSRYKGEKSMAESGRRVDIDHNYERLGARLRDAREYLGLSQEFVAEHLGVPRASVSALEAGKRKVSSLELQALARLYKRPLEYFLPTDYASADETADESIQALFRATKDLTEEDRQQVLRFAEFLRSAGRAAVTTSRKKSSEP